MSTLASCPFCDMPLDRVFYRSEFCYVVLSNPRLMPGHTLVIPNRHVLQLKELSAEERRDLFDTAIEFQSRIVERFAGGCDLRQHYRPFIKQNQLKIDHVHIHLQPRKLEDELFSKVQANEKELFVPLSDAERELVIGKLLA